VIGSKLIIRSSLIITDPLVSLSSILHKDVRDGIKVIF
jgi:hypothetical protein